MPKYRYEVEYYASSTLTSEFEADSKKKAKQAILDMLYADYDAMGKPTDWMFGVRFVRPLGRARKRKEEA